MTPDEHTRQRRNRYLKRTYGLSLEDYVTLLEFQGGLCAICGNPPKEGINLDVDHDHKSMLVRGLVHNYCNRRVIGRITVAQATTLYRYLVHTPAERAGIYAIAPKRKRRKRKRPAK